MLQGIPTCFNYCTITQAGPTKAKSQFQSCSSDANKGWDHKPWILRMQLEDRTSIWWRQHWELGILERLCFKSSIVQQAYLGQETLPRTRPALCSAVSHWWWLQRTCLPTNSPCNTMQDCKRRNATASDDEVGKRAFPQIPVALDKSCPVAVAQMAQQNTSVSFTI